MTRVRWYIGTAINVLHLPAALGLTLFGRLLLPRAVYYAAILVILALQARLRTCPLNVLVIWLKRPYEPEYEQRSIISWFYLRFGRVLGLILLTSIVGGTAAIASALGGI